MTIQKALFIALQAHKYQKDKAGQHYIFHPIKVASKMQTENEKIVALLHDTIEDSYITLDDLEKEGFSKVVIEALDYITRNENEKYQNYIKRVKKNELATKVKIEDLKHNLDPTRITNPTLKDIERNKKYIKALKYLKSKEE